MTLNNKNISAKNIYTRLNIVIFTLFLLLSLSACTEKNSDNAEVMLHRQSASILTITPEQGYTTTKHYLGQIKAKQHTNLSFEYSGNISELMFDEGDAVLKGQILAKQNTQLLDFKRAELKARTNQLKAQIKLNKANLSRIQNLLSDGYTSKQSFDELTAENEIITAQINGISAQIKTLNYQKEKASLVAPFDGVITKRLTSTGEVISASIPIYRLIEQENNEITLGVPVNVARELSLGQILDVDISMQKNMVKKARLMAIGQQLDTINRTVQLRLKMTTPLNKKVQFNGQLVRVSIDKLISTPGFWLPLEAITDGVRGQWQIFLASPYSQEASKEALFNLQATIVNIIHANENSVYVTGLPIEPHNIVSQGIHRYVGGQIVSNTTPLLPNKNQPISINTGANK